MYTAETKGRSALSRLEASRSHEPLRDEVGAADRHNQLQQNAEYRYYPRWQQNPVAMKTVPDIQVAVDS